MADLVLIHGIRMPLYAAVVVEAPITQIYHYLIPESLSNSVVPGIRVLVPFGRRKLRGVCVRLDDTTTVNKDKLKEVLETGSPDEILSVELLELTKWVAGYYASSWGMTLAAAMPAGVRKSRKEKTEMLVSLAIPPDDTPPRIAALELRAHRQAGLLRALFRHLEGGVSAVPAAALISEVGGNYSALQALATKGLIKLDEHVVNGGMTLVKDRQHEIVLNSDQSRAISRISRALSAGEFAAFLLYGVTSSGKTEVYLQALAQCLTSGRGALILVPEISLTPQTVSRFQERVGEVAVLHSHMSDGERAGQWRRINSGELRVVIGARSAVYAPIPDLGLIVVDEEHERSFKQENDPRYNGRDVAVIRARKTKAVVILGSATPSIESWQNASVEKYSLLSLPERAGGALPPVLEVVNMSEEWADRKQQCVLSRVLERRLLACRHRNEQAILFLNRRGFNTFVYCRGCGDVLKCDDCDIAFTFHRGSDVLKCHYCDRTLPAPKKCPACGAHSLYYGGTGTERVEEIIGKILPDARLLRMDSDTMTGRDAHGQALSAFARGEYDILLGTQMVTKGFDFPNVTLVGVLLADNAIHMPDFRAAERTFQLITQVVGRAGRAEKPGTAIIQAIDPTHFSVQCALKHDYQSFADHEIADRKILAYPPFGKLARIIVRGPRESSVRKTAGEIAVCLKGKVSDKRKVLGPAPCPISRIQGAFRYHIMVKGRDHVELLSLLKNAPLCGSGKTAVTVDIDPVSML